MSKNSMSRFLGKAIPPQLKSVLYLDRSVLVLNKPPGLTCQLEGGTDFKSTKGVSEKSKNAFNRILTNIQKELQLESPLFPVHRLDVGTTGCLTLAVTQNAARELSRQFVQGTISKSYLALVRGGSKSFPSKSGRIEDAICYEDGYFRSLGPNGKPSLTEWELLGSSPIAPVSLVRLRLLTGNKHQLRIHMSKSLHVPILGDDRYCKKAVAETISSHVSIPPDRTFLHASEISFFRYRSAGGHKRFRLGIRAPLPLDFMGICKQLRISVPPSAVEGAVVIDEEPVQGATIPEVDGYWFPRHPKSSPIDS